MKLHRTSRAVLVACVCVLTSSRLQAQTIDFESVASSGCTSGSAFSTQGFNFSGNSQVCQAAAYGFATQSGTQAWNSYFAVPTMSMTNASATAFTLNSFWTHSYPGGNAISGSVAGYASNSLIFSQSISLSGTWQLYTVNWSGVDRVDFSGDNSTLVVIDDITTNAVSAPEPASLALVGTGLIGMFGVARRKKSA